MYNTNLFYWIEKNAEMLQAPTSHILTVGKRICEQLAKHDLKEMKQLEELKLSSIEEITHELLEHITQAEPRYSKVVLVNNYAHTFFIRRSKETTLIPLSLEKPMDPEEESDYLWLNDKQKIVDKIAYMYLETTIRTLLFEALAGEQAARFIAMDNATRNANNFLDLMQLQYNKLRQAKITKELTELAANFQN